MFQFVPRLEPHCLKNCLKDFLCKFVLIGGNEQIGCPHGDLPWKTVLLTEPVNVPVDAFVSIHGGRFALSILISRPNRAGDAVVDLALGDGGEGQRAVLLGADAFERDLDALDEGRVLLDHLDRSVLPLRIQRASLATVAAMANVAGLAKIAGLANVAALLALVARCPAGRSVCSRGGEFAAIARAGQLTSRR